MPSKRALLLLSWCLGLVGAMTQVMIIRELLVAFTGNELTIATSLAFWLLSVAAGCFIFRRSAGATDKASAAGVLFIVAGVAAPVQVVLIRLLHPLTVTFGEIPGPVMIALLSLIGLVPCAMTLGGLFVELVSLAERSRQTAPAPVIYGAEALGSGVGGVLLSVYLLEHLNPIMIVSLAAIVSVSSGLYLSRVTTADVARGRRAAALILACLIAVTVLSQRLDLGTRKIQWRPLRVEETVDTKYGNIVVTGRDGIHDFFESGLLAFTVPDPLYAEEAVHIPLLHHPMPESVLIIGGAGSGAVAEAMKHPTVKRIDYVELDPAATDLAKRYSAPGWLEGDGIEVTPVYGDGRHYVARTTRHYDAVIVNVGQPLSLQLNRYYTVGFFNQVKAVLRPGGMMSLMVASEGAYVGPELASLLSALANGCRAVFRHVGIVPGEYIHLLASSDLEISRQTDLILEEISDRRLNTGYVTRYTLWDRLSPVRVAHLDSVIAMFDTGAVNTDRSPVSFSYSISLWAKHFRSGKVISLAVAWLNMRNCLFLLVLAGLAIAGANVRGAGIPWSGFPAALAIYSMGLTTMFTEVLIVLSFQVISGYIYTRIAAIVAAFMFGMGTASSLMGTKPRGPLPRQTLPTLHACLAVLPLSVLAVFNLLKGDGGPWPHAADILFPILALATGAVGGAIFAVSSSCLAARSPSATRAGAIAYSLDLTGACIAGFATGFLVIPALGLARSAYVVSLFSLITLIPVLARPR